MPALGLGELIGRRVELRITLRALRGDERERENGTVGGVVLSGRVCSATSGPVSLAAIWRELLDDLAGSTLPWAGPLAAPAGGAPADDEAEISQLHRVLRQHPVVLVLDDFEANLSTDATAFRDEGSAQLVKGLLAASRTGKLLITCRYPLPRFGRALHKVPVGPLSAA